MPGNIELSGLEVSLVNVMSREVILKDYIIGGDDTVVIEIVIYYNFNIIFLAVIDNIVYNCFFMLLRNAKNRYVKARGE